MDAFLANPPEGFRALRVCGGVPAFITPFDLLTTADAALQRFVDKLPWRRFWRRLLRPRTFFLGTTVSEYAVLPRGADPAAMADCLWNHHAREQAFAIVKDLPCAPDLVDADSVARADALLDALTRRGFVPVEGQALAYVPIDFTDIDAFLARMSRARRKDIRRKLRTRAKLRIERLATGDPAFADPALLDRIYHMYRNVYEQSEIHFDVLSPEFFAAVLRDAGNGGVMFLYHDGDALIGWNLCFETADTLVDKFVGFVYPEAREMNLYFVSWIHNLEYALERGVRTYVAGWTDPEVKARLGARFTMTRHAVYARNPLVRAALRRMAGRFALDHDWAEAGDASDRA